MNKEGFGSQNSMALGKSATVDGKDMQTTKCLVTKLPSRECCKEVSSAFCVGIPLTVRAQGSGVLNHTTCFHSYLNSKLSLKLIGREKTKIENFTSEAHSADVINLFPNQDYFQLSIAIYVPF